MVRPAAAHACRSIIGRHSRPTYTYPVYAMIPNVTRIHIFRTAHGWGVDRLRIRASETVAAKVPQHLCFSGAAAGVCRGVRGGFDIVSSVCGGEDGYAPPDDGGQWRD